MSSPYYDDGVVRLHLGDCREVLDWLDGDVLVTDPPYGIGYSRGANAARQSKSSEGIVNDDDTGHRDATAVGERGPRRWPVQVAPRPGIRWLHRRLAWHPEPGLPSVRRLRRGAWLHLHGTAI